MARRWYASPVVTDASGVRLPKVATYKFQDGVDVEGNPIMRAWFSHRSIISSGRAGQRNDLAISIVEPRPGADFSLLEADAECIDIIAEIRELLGRDWDEDDRRAWYDMTPRQIGLNRGQLNNILNKMSSFGADTTGLTLDTTLGVFFTRLTDLIDFGLDVREVW